MQMVMSEKNPLRKDLTETETRRLTMLHHPQYFYGVHREDLQRIMARAHRERSEYIVALLKRLFGRRTEASVTRGHPTAQGSAAASHC